MKRIFFKKQEEREIFFRKLLEKYKKWKDICSEFQIKKNTLKKYREGKFTIPEKVFDNMKKVLSKENSEYFRNKVDFLEKNWGNIKGGKNNYLKNRNILEEGRKKANENKNKKNNLFKQKELNSDIAYLVGLFIGDGFTNKYNGHYLTQFTGHAIHEREYYSKIILPLIKKEFSLNPKLNVKENTLRCNIYSKGLFQFLTERLKISAGKKSRSVLIPEEILKSEEKMLFSCIAGIYDAEGSIYFDNRKKYKQRYAILEIHLNNINLVNQINSILKKKNLETYYRENRIYLYGKKKINSFLKIVPLKNPKILNKII